jgi:hypothetical protein
MDSRPGAPHFSGFRKEKKQQRNLEEAIYEFIDNVISKCLNIHIKINENALKDKITRIIISDDYEQGIENLDKNGHENPINFYYMNGKGKSHKDDSESSQFGTGFKSAAIALCSLFSFVTKNKEKFTKIGMDFDVMEDQKDINDSYQPTEMRDITEKEYRCIHPFEYGSTFIIERMDQTMFMSGITLEQFCDNLIEKIQDTYGNIIKSRNINITVNNIRVNPKKYYVDLDSVSPFKTEHSIFLADYMENLTWIIREENGYGCSDKLYVYNKDNQGKPGKRDLKTISEDEICESKDSKEYKDKKLKVLATTFQFCPEFREDLKNKKSVLPNGIASFYKHGRRHGDFKVEYKDGNSNYIYIVTSCNSKLVATELGITSSKDLKSKGNDLSLTLKALIKKIRNKYNCNTRESNKTYKNNLEYISKFSKQNGFNIFIDEKKKSKVKNESDSESDIESDSKSDNEEITIIRKSMSVQQKSLPIFLPSPEPSPNPSSAQQKSLPISLPSPNPSSNPSSAQQKSLPISRPPPEPSSNPSSVQQKSLPISRPPSNPSSIQQKSLPISIQQKSLPISLTEKYKSPLIAPSSNLSKSYTINPLNDMISKQEAIDMMYNIWIKIGIKISMTEDSFNKFVDEWKIEINK